MANADQSELSPIQKLLAAIFAYLIPTTRSEGDFLVAFSPRVIMQCIDSVELRASILLTAAKTPLSIGRKTSPASAGEYLELSLAENEVTPEMVLGVFGPHHRARYLDRTALWAFIEAHRLWETYDGPGEAKKANDLIILILETALKLELLTPEEVVRAISVRTFFEKESKERTVEALELFADAEPGKGFDALLDRYTPSVMVTQISLMTIWNSVIHPLIAVRNKLAPATESAGAQEVAVHPNQSESGSATEPAVGKPIASGSSPVSSTAPLATAGSSSVSKSPSGSLSGGMIRPSAAPIAGTHASAVPPASRVSGSTGSNPESGTTLPKGSAASDDTTVADADEGTTVDERDLLGDEAPQETNADADALSFADEADADTDASRPAGHAASSHDPVIEVAPSSIASSSTSETTVPVADAEQIVEHPSHGPPLSEEAPDTVVRTPRPRGSAERARSPTASQSVDSVAQALLAGQRNASGSSPTASPASLRAPTFSAPTPSQRPPSGTMPAVTRVPRPRIDTQSHHTDDSVIEVQVGAVRASDPEIADALMNEPPDDAVQVPQGHHARQHVSPPSPSSPTKPTGAKPPPLPTHPGGKGPPSFPTK